VFALQARGEGQNGDAKQALDTMQHHKMRLNSSPPRYKTRLVFAAGALCCGTVGANAATTTTTETSTESNATSDYYDEGPASVFNLPRNLNVLFLSTFLAGLILVAMMLDHALHLLHEGLSSTKLKMLEKLKDELMILGLISFILTMMEQSGVHLPHDELLIFEFTHILVFVVALMLVLYTAQLMLMESRILRTWHAFDSSPALYRCGAAQNAVAQKLNEEESKRGMASMSRSVLGVTSKLREGAEFHVARALFLDEHALGERFDFTEYLHRVLVANIVDMLDVRRGCWLIVILLDLLNLLRDYVFKELHIEQNDSGVVVFVAVGLFFVCCDLAIVHSGRNLWWECLRLAAPLLRRGEKLSAALVDARSQGVIKKRCDAGKNLHSIIRTIRKLSIELDVSRLDLNGAGSKWKRLAAAGRRVRVVGLDTEPDTDADAEQARASVPRSKSKRETFSGVGKSHTEKRLRRFGFGVETMVVLQCFYTACFVLYFVGEWTRLLRRRFAYDATHDDSYEADDSHAEHRMLEASTDGHDTSSLESMLTPPPELWLWIMLVLMILPVPVHILFVSQRNLKTWTLLQAVTVQHRELFKIQLEVTEEREKAYSQLRANFMVKNELESSLCITSDNPDVVKIFRQYSTRRESMEPEGFMRLCRDCASRGIKLDHLKAFARMVDREQRFFDEMHVDDVGKIRQAISKRARRDGGARRSTFARAMDKSTTLITLAAAGRGLSSITGKSRSTIQNTTYIPETNARESVSHSVTEGTFSFDVIAKFFRGLDASPQAGADEPQQPNVEASSGTTRLHGIDSVHNNASADAGISANEHTRNGVRPREPLGAVLAHKSSGSAWKNPTRPAQRHGQQMFRKRTSM
jgi:hypothetical protein